MTQEKFSKSLAKCEVDGLFSDNPEGLRKLFKIYAGRFFRRKYMSIFEQVGTKGEHSAGAKETDTSPEVLRRELAR